MFQWRVGEKRRNPRREKHSVFPGLIIVALIHLKGNFSLLSQLFNIVVRKFFGLLSSSISVLSEEYFFCDHLRNINGCTDINKFFSDALLYKIILSLCRKNWTRIFSSEILYKSLLFFRRQNVSINKRVRRWQWRRQAGYQKRIKIYIFFY